MRQKCIQAVSAAIGRPINKAEADGIEQRILRSMSAEARKDPRAWQQLPQADRLRAAAQRAAGELLLEAQQKRVREAQNIVAQSKMGQVIADAKAAGKKPAHAVFGEFERADAYRKGVERDYYRRLTDAMKAIEGRMLGLIEDGRMAKAVIDEIYGRDSGSALAKKAAAAWLDTAEAMRVRFNRSGGEMGKLDYGYLPQSHDQVRVLRAGQAQWVAEVLPLMDRSRYVHPDGTRFNDADMTAFLNESWNTISSGGTNKIQPGQFQGKAGLAGNPASKTRELHFAGPDEFAAYQQVYGGKSVLGAMQAHVGRMARDIALAENLGPNWRGTVQRARDTMRQAGDSTRVNVGAGNFDVGTAFETMAGTYNQPAHAQIAQVMQGARNLQVAAKLGGAVLSSITDAATLVVTAGYHRLPMLQTLGNVLRAFGPDAKRFADRAGLIGDSMISDMNRWAEGNLGHGWTSKLANATMQASLLNAWTDSMRRGFGISMMGAMGEMSRRAWGALDAGDRVRLERAGFTAADWTHLQAVVPEQWSGQRMLTPEAIHALPIDQATRDTLAAKVLGYITDESEFAVVNPDLATRTIAQGGTAKGTATGELWRSVMLFKSFPIAMITRHWRRALSDETIGAGGKLAYTGALLVGLTTMGYLAMSAKDVAKGKDPRDVDSPKTWGAAFLQGGGFGIFGDFLFADQNRFGNSLTETLAGPLFGTLSDLVKLTVGNAQEAAQGKDTHAAAEAVRFLSSNTPGSSLWYARSALDRVFLHQLQESLSPGYIGKVRARAAKDGSTYWWEPGAMEPARAPRFENMIPGGEP